MLWSEITFLRTLSKWEYQVILTKRVSGFRRNTLPLSSLKCLVQERCFYRVSYEYSSMEEKLFNLVKMIIIIIITDKMLRLKGGKMRVFHIIEYIFEISTIIFL